MLGCLGLLVTGIWSFTIAWWAPAVLVAAYFLQMVLIPSAMPAAIQAAEDHQASSAVQHAVKELDNASELLKAAERGGASQEEVEIAINRAMEAVERAKPLIQAVPDLRQRGGLLFFLQDHLEKFQAAIDRLGAG